MSQSQYLILDVHTDHQKTVQSVSANGEHVLSNITQENLSSYLKQLRGEGWEFVHYHTMDPLYGVYYFKRPPDGK